LRNVVSFGYRKPYGDETGMLSFSLTPKLEKELIKLQSKITVIWTNLERVSIDEANYLQHQALISTIGASTRIENAVLTDQEVEWVDTTLSEDGKTTAFEEKKHFIIDKLSKDRERSIEEVAGCREMLHTIYQQASDFLPLTETHIRGLHNQLLRYYPPAAQYIGNYKTSPNKVVAINHATGQKHTVLNPAEPGMINETAMADLVSWYNITQEESPWPILVAIEFVFRFLAIHPFQDGNGRLGRGLFLLALMHSDDPALQGLSPLISIDRQIEKKKTQYYTVLHQCSNGNFSSDPSAYDYFPIVRFLIRVVDEALMDVTFYRTRYENFINLSESALIVLKSFKASPERRLKVIELEDTTSLPRRTIQYNLKNLTEKGFLQRLGSGAGSRYQLIF
jgi:Fic family protein